MDNQQVRLLFEISWLVGIIEGEGCFGLNNNCTKMKDGSKYMYPRVSITNSDIELLNACVVILKDLKVAHYIVKKTRQRENNPCYTIIITGFKRVKRILELIIPFMIGEKLPQCKILLKFINSRLNNGKIEAKFRQYTNHEKELIQQFKSLRMAQKSKNPRDCTPNFPIHGLMIQSELERNLKRLTEMINPTQ